MGYDFSGKVAIVTGAAAGIGRVTAEALARAGAKVTVADVDGVAGEAAVGHINAAGGTARFELCDVSKAAAVERMVQQTVAAFGRLDILVSNAAIDPEISFEAEWDIDTFDRVQSINLRGAFLCTKFGVKPMLEQGSGCFVNIASFAGVSGVPNKPAYCAAKHGVIGLTRAAALQYARRGIRFNAVSPGGVDTEMTARNLRLIENGEAMIKANHPIGRMGTPSEIADAILWLCSEHASFVLGHNLLVDGGLAV